MPQIQIPDFVGQNQAFEQARQNQMLNISRLRAGALEQGEQQRTIQKRNELESLLRATPEPERDRAAFEWSKVNDQALHGRLAMRSIQKLQTQLGLNPQGALASFENATGERLQYDPAGGLVRVPMDDGSFLAVSPKGLEHIKSEKPLAVRETEAERIAAAQTRGRVSETPPPAIRPDTTLTPTEFYKQDPKAYESMQEANARARAKYRTVPDRAGGGGALSQIQSMRLRQSAKNKKDRALAQLEREYRSPVAFGRMEPMGDEELLQRKQQIQNDFEDDLRAGGFDVTPFSYSGQVRLSSQSQGNITREQALQELRRRGVIR